MLKIIARKEALETILSYRFPLFTLIVLILIPLGLFVNQADYGQRLRDYQEQTRLAEEAAKSLKIQDIMAGTLILKGFRRPAPLSIFTQGCERTLPAYYAFTQDGSAAGESVGGGDSILAVQGKVDFVFLIQMVVSLIALLFASDMISGEKEAGTLRAMLSNPLPRDALLAGKAGGGFLALWIPFLLSFLVGLAVLLAVGFPLFGGDGAARIATVFLISSFFILTYYVLGLAASAATAKARTSLVAILILWTAFQLIVPKMSDMAARLIHPVRTEAEISLQKSLLVNALAMEQARELGREYDRIFAGVPESANEENSPERKRWDPIREGIQLRFRERKSRELGAIDETFSQEKRRQTNLALNLSLVSPSAAFARLVSDICGTGELERSRYAAAVRSHQNALDAELFSKVKRTVMIHESGGTSLGFTAMPVDASKLPKFTVASATLAEAFRANGRSLVSLILWLIVPFAFAYTKFLKYDVR